MKSLSLKNQALRITIAAVATMMTLCLALACGDGTAVTPTNSSTNPGTGTGPGGNEAYGTNSPYKIAYFPAWHDATPTETINLSYDSGKTDEQNGDALADAVEGLTAGQKLVVADGTYSVNKLWEIQIHGTQAAPIWIVAADGATPVITRPNASQNTLNVGGNVEFVCLRGFEFTGGSIIIRIKSCNDLWLDQCYVHHGDVNGVTANSGATYNLYVTRNLIANTPRSGIYCGTHDGSYGMKDSVIALNHIHHCGLDDDMGYGIQVKQNSYDNLIAENHVHNTHWPCVILYSAGGIGVNVVEKNVIYKSNDTVLQVQGDAVVRNNLVMGDTVAFTSRHHTADPDSLTVVHNTIISTTHATSLADWDGATAMVFANNVAYSRDGGSIRFVDGSGGAAVSGNVALGSVSGISAGYVTGNGLSDFVNVSWDLSSRDAAPSAGSPIIGAATASHAVVEDINGTNRVTDLDSGAFDYKN